MPLKLQSEVNPDMTAHTTLHVSDYTRSKAFYVKALEPLGYTNNMEYGEAAGVNDGKNTNFWIACEDTDVPTHLAFEAGSRQEVEAFYKARWMLARRRIAARAIATTGRATMPRLSMILTVTISRPSGTTTVK